MMSREHSIPPLRDLPPGRFGQRAEHFRAEVDRVGRDRTRTYALAAVAASAILAIVLAVPAFGVQGRIVHLFSSQKQRPPELIQRYFRNLAPYPGGPPGVIPGKARIALEVRVPGYGGETLWVAATRNGGFCTTAGCDSDRRTRFHSLLKITGPTRRNSQPMRGSPDVHVLFEGYAVLHGAARIAVRFEDGSSQFTPLVWVSKPIDAGFFIYELPKERWKIGKRPVAFAVEDAQGKRLARDTKIAGYFRHAQSTGLAPPSAADSSHWFLWTILGAAVVLVAAALGTALVKPGWARRA
jgi:hypothetical protein